MGKEVFISVVLVVEEELLEVKVELVMVVMKEVETVGEGGIGKDGGLGMREGGHSHKQCFSSPCCFGPLVEKSGGFDEVSSLQQHQLMSPKEGGRK